MHKFSATWASPISNPQAHISSIEEMKKCPSKSLSGIGNPQTPAIINPATNIHR